MPARILALYGHPTDPAAFDGYYTSKHVPLAKKLPGLLSYTISRGAVGTGNGQAPYYLVAELDFDSVAAIQAALSSSEGSAVGADLSNFATGGVTLVWYDVADA